MVNKKQGTGYDAVINGVRYRKPVYPFSRYQQKRFVPRYEYISKKGYHRGILGKKLCLKPVNDQLHTLENQQNTV